MRRSRLPVVLLCAVLGAVCFGTLTIVTRLGEQVPGYHDLSRLQMAMGSQGDVLASERFPSEGNDAAFTEEINGGGNFSTAAASPPDVSLEENYFGKPEGGEVAIETNLMQQHTFSNKAYDIPDGKALAPNLGGYLAGQASDINSFLQEDLHTSPNNSGFLSRQLHTTSEVIKESQRLHFDILARELSGFKYAMLFDIAAFENKGDACITVGEIYFLARINIQIVYYCSAFSCNDRLFQEAAEKAKQYSPKELVILNHGGGNIVGYKRFDVNRFLILKLFKNYRTFVFPQSIYVKNFSDPFLETCRENYCCNENVTFVMRDQQSYGYAKKYFEGGNSKFLMAPDMAFQVGPMKRFLSPVFDVMWIKRHDSETPGYKTEDNSPQGVRVHVSDWKSWNTPGAHNNIEKAHYQCTNGFFYLQRGRVVITDRLHGHILATLMDIPHVLIDNREHKLSAYHNTWTAGVENTVITDDPAKALPLALKLLEQYNNTIPPRVPFLHINEKHNEDNLFDKIDSSYS